MGWLRVLGTGCVRLGSGERGEWRRNLSSGLAEQRPAQEARRARTWAAAAGGPGSGACTDCSVCCGGPGQVRRLKQSFSLPLVSQQGKLKTIIKDEKRPGAAEKGKEGVCDMLLTGPDSASHLCGEPRAGLPPLACTAPSGALPPPPRACICPGVHFSAPGPARRPHIISIRIQTCYYSQAEETKHNPLKLTFSLGTNCHSLHLPPQQCPRSCPGQPGKRNVMKPQTQLCNRLKPKTR